MTIKELISILMDIDPDYEIYVNNPTDTENYFVDRIEENHQRKQAFIRTAE
jgi:hypothetical protein